LILENDSGSPFKPDSTLNSIKESGIKRECKNVLLRSGSVCYSNLKNINETALYLLYFCL